MNILILGAEGQLGKSFEKVSSEFNFNFYFKNKSQINIIDPDISSFDEIDFIINCAAYTDVDGAELDEQLAFQINYESIKKLSEISNESGAPLIHFSTDYLYDGNATKPISENIHPNPLNVYGKSKLAGERALSSSCKNFLILRTSWVFSEFGKNFLKKIVSIGLKNEEIKVINDQMGSPTYAPDISLAVLNFINQNKSKSFGQNLYNFSGNSAITWYQFALMIKKEAEDMNFTFSSVSPVKTKEFVQYNAAQRPGYSVLDNEKILKDYDIVPSDVEKGIKNSLMNYLPLNKNDFK